MHDELVFELRPSDLGAVAAIVKECMEGAVVLNVPLHVKLSTGPSWGSLRALELCGGGAVPPEDLTDTGFGSGFGAAPRLGRAAAVNLPPSQVQHTVGGAPAGSRPAVPPPVARDLFGKD